MPGKFLKSILYNLAIYTNLLFFQVIGTLYEFTMIYLTWLRHLPRVSMPTADAYGDCFPLYTPSADMKEASVVSCCRDARKINIEFVIKLADFCHHHNLSIRLVQENTYRYSLKMAY